MKSTQLAIIPSRVQPKPTRAEIIDALTEIKIIRIRKQNKYEAEKKGALRKELEIEIMARHREKEDEEPNIRIGYVNAGKAYGVEIEFSVNNITPDMHKKLTAYHKLSDRHCEPDRHRVRKEIAARVLGAEPKEARVLKLLTDTESRKALEEMLESI